MEKASKHSSHLVIEGLAQTVSIFDFYSNRADVFYSLANHKQFQHHAIGPAMLAPFLPSFHALMLHASAIVRNGRAAVFLAPDEGGKTTAVRLAPSGTILCDDQVIVRRGRGGFRAWGTPWGLHVDARTSAPLSGLFLLKKAKRFALEPLQGRSLIPFIWEEIKNPLSILPKPLKKKAFSILCDIVESVPCWTLSFPKNHIDWNEIDAALKRTGKKEDTRHTTHR